MRDGGNPRRGAPADGPHLSVWKSLRLAAPMAATQTKPARSGAEGSVASSLRLQAKPSCACVR